MYVLMCMCDDGWCVRMMMDSVYVYVCVFDVFMYMYVRTYIHM